MKKQMKLKTRRVSTSPLEVGRRPSPPMLPRLVSKFGGAPYLERTDEWPTHDGKRMPFVAQLVLREIDPALTGCLSIFQGLSADPLLAFRFHPDPSEERAAVVDGPSAGAFECRIEASDEPGTFGEPFEEIDGPGPRTWWPERPVDPAQWVQLIDLDDGAAGLAFGSFTVTVLVERGAFARGEFGDVRFLIWQ